MAKYVLVNSWHDSNKGDSAILHGMLNMLYKVDPECRVTVVSILDKQHPAFPTCFRHTASRFPDVEYLGTPIPHIGKHLLGILAAGAEAAIPQVIELIAQRAFEHIYCNKDLIIAVGGQYFFSDPGIVGKIRVQNIMHSLTAARRLNRRYSIYGQSLGPIATRSGKKIITSILQGASAVYVRESLSLDQLKSYDLPSWKVGLVPDAAFAIHPCHDKCVDGILRRLGLTNRQFIAVTVRQWPRVGRSVYKQFLVDLACSLCDVAIASGLDILVVAHTLGPTQIEDDRIASKEFVQELNRIARSLCARINIKYMDDDLSPEQLAALYGCSAAVVGMRFHSVILAMVGGAPALAISYFGPKAEGIMKDMGLNGYVFSMSNMEQEALRHRLWDVLERPGIRSYITERAIAAREEAYRVFAHMLTLSQK